MSTSVIAVMHLCGPSVKAVHTARQKTTPKAQQKREKQGMRLEDESGTLGLLVTTELEVLASLEGEL
jgi:hypothetical protein